MNSSRSNASKNSPLAGMRILVGRARHQASALSAGLKKLGAEVIEIPFIEIRKPRSYKPLDTALKAIADYDWLILTSVNGVEALSARMKRLRISPRNLKNVMIAAIGPATRQEIERLGLTVSVLPERYIAESVVESLRGKVEGKRVLLARARVARDVIPRELRKMGAHVDVVEAYETVVPASSRARLRSIMKSAIRGPHVVTFTSSSTVRNFVALLGGRRRAPHKSPGRLQFASIGPITSATLRDLGLPVHIEATEYTIPGLIDAIARI
jgi:uroporphyrinogen-III synthase